MTLTAPLLFLSCWFASIVAVSKVHPTVDLVRAAGFPVEEHQTVTEDGYLIILHRIPPRTTRPLPGRVVVYMHGLFGSSIDLVIRGRDKGFAFQLSEAGFDVWLPNLRGTTHTHPITLNMTKNNPWDFSWDENALFDFPAIMDYVLAVTRAEKIKTMGLSMAANVILGGLSLRPYYNQRLSGMVFLAPTTRMKYTSSVIKKASPHWQRLQKLVEASRIYWLPFVNVDLFRRFMSWLCSLPHVGVIICASLMFSTESIVFAIEKELVPKIFQHYPHPGPTKSVIHYLQIMDSGRFCAFDYGKEENLRRYGQASSPDYDLSKVTAPAAIFYSRWDTMVNYKDAEWLASQLNNTVIAYAVPKRKFAHLSFMWDPNLKNLVYNKVISVLLSL